MDARQINTPLRQAHFLAQLGQESDSFATAEEYASGQEYEGRRDLGNTHPGDGKRFKGRGLIQLTGRSNYAAYGTAIARNLTSGTPSVVATDHSLAVDVSTWFWQTHNLNHLADSDNVNAVTRVVNGGLNGIHNRVNYLQRAKFFFGL
jgi:putative chitinase